LPRADLAGHDLSVASFRDCSFDGLQASETQLLGAEFVDCRFTEPFATTLLAGRSTWRQVRIERPRWGSADLYDADLTSVDIRGGKIDYLDLRGSRLTDVRIEGCVIDTLDLAGFRGKRVAVPGCQMGTLDLGGATCEYVDLRGSSFRVVNGLEGLRGATIDDAQLMELAPLLARHIGVRVG
jgi:uncharacterized protein YjbI with pentapeptide repeats